MSGEWSPCCERPSDLVRPVRIDPEGVAGPTAYQARGSRWRRTSPGLFVPDWVDDQVVEQRILEQSARIGVYGAVSGWAALRWRGATYFNGRARGETLPVPLAVGRECVRPDPAVEVIRRQTPPTEWEVVDGMPCTTAARALFDEVIRLGRVRPAVVAVDMAVAAGLVTVPALWDFLRHIGPRNGVVLAREATLLAGGDSRSPQESWMRLCWILDAGLPPPLCNVPVFDRRGNLLGIPDLFDPVAGVVGEYQGEVHRSLEQHRSDVMRAERFREHGLVYFEVVGGQLREIQTAYRMRRLRAAGRFESRDDAAWTLDQPAWWQERQVHSRAS